MTRGTTKPEAKVVIPWFRQAYVQEGHTVCKDHWVAIQHGNRVVYAQWEDCGPFRTDHYQYVFGAESRVRTSTAARAWTCPRPCATPWA